MRLLCAGVERRADGSRLEMHFTDGLANGAGVLYTPDGGQIKGTWVNDLLHGPATTVLPDGGAVKTMWHEGAMTGTSTVLAPVRERHPQLACRSVRVGGAARATVAWARGGAAGCAQHAACARSLTHSAPRSGKRRSRLAALGRVVSGPWAVSGPWVVSVPWVVSGLWAVGGERTVAPWAWA
eukprot:7224658-Prymnesium_polylepis.1